MLEVSRRTDAFLTSLDSHPVESTILICTHGGVLTTLLATLLETPLDEMLVHNFRNASLTIVEKFGLQVRVSCFNCVQHLDGCEGLVT